MFGGACFAGFPVGNDYDLHNDAHSILFRFFIILSGYVNVKIGLNCYIFSKAWCALSTAGTRMRVRSLVSCQERKISMKKRLFIACAALLLLPSCASQYSGQNMHNDAANGPPQLIRPTVTV
jgi:hypothetical protein